MADEPVEPPAVTIMLDRRGALVFATELQRLASPPGAPVPPPAPERR